MDPRRVVPVRTVRAARWLVAPALGSLLLAATAAPLLADETTDSLESSTEELSDSLSDSLDGTDDGTEDGQTDTGGSTLEDTTGDDGGDSGDSTGELDGAATDLTSAAEDLDEQGDDLLSDDGDGEQSPDDGDGGEDDSSEPSSDQSDEPDGSADEESGGDRQQDGAGSTRDDGTAGRDPAPAPRSAEEPAGRQDREVRRVAADLVLTNRALKALIGTDLPDRVAPRGPDARGAPGADPEVALDGMFPLSGPYEGPGVDIAPGPRSTQDIFERLVEIGASPEIAVSVITPFPVLGPARYSNDWHAPRTVPYQHLHEGTDIFAEEGTPVIAVADGTITDVGRDTSIGGNTVKLTTADGTYYYYAHLDSVFDDITAGTSVKQGTLLGFVGNTGNARTTPYHLHFEIHPEGGAAVPPVPVLDEWLEQARDKLDALTGEGSGEPAGFAPVVADGSDGGQAAQRPDDQQTTSASQSATANGAMAGAEGSRNDATLVTSVMLALLFALFLRLLRRPDRRRPAEDEPEGFLELDLANLERLADRDHQPAGAAR